MVNHWDIYIFILKILIIRIVLNSIKFKHHPVIGFRFSRKNVVNHWEIHIQNFEIWNNSNSVKFNETQMLFCY